MIIMPKNIRIAFLICSYLNKSISEPQLAELEEWLEEREENMKLFKLINTPVYIDFARTELLN
jgi:hypothetical protein